MLSGLLKSIPGKSLVLPLFVSVALSMRPLRGLGAVLLGSRCGLERAGLKMQQGSQAAGQILEFIEENRNGICLRYPHHSHLIRLLVWDPELTGPGCVVSRFWLLHSSVRAGRPIARRHCQGQAVQVHQNYVKVQEGDRDGSMGHNLSRRLISDQGMPRRVQDKHLEKKTQTEEFGSLHLITTPHDLNLLCCGNHNPHAQRCPDWTGFVNMEGSCLFLRGLCHSQCNQESSYIWRLEAKVP